jgi:hypothetical protein
MADEVILNQRDIKQIEKHLKEYEDMFMAEGRSKESIESILAAMRIGMEIAKKENKRKFTPKKYKA